MGYLALFIALGGTSYATLSLPAGSVGTRQLRNGSVTAKKLANGSITPVKLDPSTIGGSVRHWAFVSQDGRFSAAATEFMRRADAARPVISRELGRSLFVALCACSRTPQGATGTSRSRTGSACQSSSRVTRTERPSFGYWPYISGAATSTPVLHRGASAERGCRAARSIACEEAFSECASRGLRQPIGCWRSSRRC